MIGPNALRGRRLLPSPLLARARFIGEAAEMADHSTVDMKILRRIGWDHWDPIGIRQVDDPAWRTIATSEYDSYLLRAANMLLHGSMPAAVAAYLEEIVVIKMGLGPVSDVIQDAAIQTVDAIATYLQSRSTQAHDIR